MELNHKSSIANHKCLIAGCGYVGLPLGAQLVQQGHEVFGIRRNAAAEHELLAAGIHPLIVDITNPVELARLPRDFDLVVSCIATHGGSVEDYRRIYLQGTSRLIEWLSDSPVKKFIYTSSTSVFGQTDGSVVSEGSATEPASETAKVLLETERLLLQTDGSRERSSRPGQPAVVLRVAGIYGPDRGHWFRQFLKGEARIEGDGSRFLNMIHRDDVVGSIMAALESGRAGEIYNAVDDEPVSQVNFFRWLADELGRPMPPFVPENPAESRKRGLTNKRVSNRKLKMELGYQFKYPDYRSGYTSEILRLEQRGKLP